MDSPHCSAVIGFTLDALMMCTRLKPSWQLPFWVQPVMRERTMMMVRMGSSASSCSQRYNTTIPSLLVSSLQRASLQRPWAWLVPLPVRWYECGMGAVWCNRRLLDNGVSQCLPTHLGCCLLCSGLLCLGWCLLCIVWERHIV